MYNCFPVIEKYTDNVRFCIICNYLSKIIPALQSRCTKFRFGPLSPELMVPRLDFVIQQEKYEINLFLFQVYFINFICSLTVADDGKQALVTLANGDMRKVLNVLQSTWMAYKSVTEETVYTCVGHPLKSDITNIIKWLLNDSFSVAYKSILLYVICV